jgi:hypothetical protein
MSGRCNLYCAGPVRQGGDVVPIFLGIGCVISLRVLSLSLSLSLSLVLFWMIAVVFNFWESFYVIFVLYLFPYFVVEYV